jgi:hypothetical protein
LAAGKVISPKPNEAKLVKPKSGAKRRPNFLIEAVSLLTSDASEDKVGMAAFG